VLSPWASFLILGQDLGKAGVEEVTLKGLLKRLAAIERVVVPMAERLQAADYLAHRAHDQINPILGKF
jgi:hypothetical protein